MTKNVAIIGNDHFVRSMFVAAGWNAEEYISPLQVDPLPDLICFTGGDDVDPSYYNENKLPSTFSDPQRDAVEARWFNTFIGTPKVGICRGGQFLNVMCGGKLNQHIYKHTSTSHGITSIHHDDPFYVNSDHHQEILPNPDKPEDYEILAVSTVDNIHEVVWYPTDQSLCFQPHPEWKHEPTRKYFFELLNTYWGF